MVLFLTILKGGVDYVYIHTFRLWSAIEHTIPTASVNGSAREDELAPTIVNIHFEGHKPLSEVLPWIEILIDTVTIW